MEEFNITGSLYKGGTELPKYPQILTRFEKGQALSHAEMDTNLTSLLHTCSISTMENPGKDAQFVTFHYAPQLLVDGGEFTESTSFSRPDISFQTMPSKDDVLIRVANETVPGNLGVSGSLTISGDLHLNGRLFVNETMHEFSKEQVDSFTVQSDERLKTNLKPIGSCLEKALQITPYIFEWKEEAENEGQDVGMVAQEVQKVYPEAVYEGEDGYLRVNYRKLIPLLLGAIRELYRIV